MSSISRRNRPQKKKLRTKRRPARIDSDTVSICPYTKFLFGIYYTSRKVLFVQKAGTYNFFTGKRISQLSEKFFSGGYRFIAKFLKRDKIWLLLKNRKNSKHHVRQLPLFVWHSEVKCPSSKFPNFFLSHSRSFYQKDFLKEVF